MEYRLQVYKQICYLFQCPSKVVTKTADAKIKNGVTKKWWKGNSFDYCRLGLVGKELQNHKYCHKNHKRVPSKSSYYTPNTSMENFTPDLNSAIDIIEQKANLEPRNVPVYCFLQAIGYDQKDKSCHRFMKSKLFGKYNHRETSYSNFKWRCKHIHRKRHQACPGHQPLINLAKILDEHPRLFWTFSDMLYLLKIFIVVVHLIAEISYWCLLMMIYFFALHLRTAKCHRKKDTDIVFCIAWDISFHLTLKLAVLKLHKLKLLRVLSNLHQCYQFNQKV